MEKYINELEKYIPVIEFMISVDREKYKKFIDIKNWIQEKKNFPAEDIEKIERSIITQYKTMKNVKKPKWFKEIINPSTPVTCFVDLCADDDDESIESSTASLTSEKKCQEQEHYKINGITDEIFDKIEQIARDFDSVEGTPEEELFTRRPNNHKKSRKRKILEDKANFELIVLSSSENEDNPGDELSTIFHKKTPTTSTVHNVNNISFIPNRPSASTKDASIDITRNEYDKFLNELGETLSTKDISLLRDVIYNVLKNQSNDTSGQKVITSCTDLNRPSKQMPLNVQNTDATSYTQTQAQSPMFEPQSQMSTTSIHNLLRTRINFNDPRVIKQLQNLQNSAKSHVSNITPRPTIIKDHSHTTNEQMASCLKNTVLDNLPTPGSRLMLKGQHSKITYGEYKKRKAQEALQKEKTKNSKNNDAEIDQQRKTTEIVEMEKTTNEIRSIICNAHLNIEKENDNARKHYNQQSTVSENRNENYSKNEGIQNTRKEAPKESEESKSNNKVDRMYENLHCTIEGFNTMNGVMSNKSTVSESSNEWNIKNAEIQNTRKVASKQLEQSKPNKLERIYRNLQCTMEGFNTMKGLISASIGGKRRSSLHAREMISVQLENRNDTSCSSSEDDTITKIKLRRKSDGQYKIQSCKRKNVSETNNENKVNSTSKDISLHKSHTPRNEPLKLPVLKLNRLKCNNNSKHTIETSKVTNVSLPPKRTDHIENTNDKLQSQSRKRKQCKILNNNCEMTEKNTRFCALCTSKPINLVNHYVRKHKTESFISRLTFEQITTLEENTNFAQSEYKQNSYNFFKKPSSIRYKVYCPFCTDDLMQTFYSLYEHFSKHTGEYSYMCSGCALMKPFRADIRSHQQHSKNCSKASINTMYRYRADTTVIYAYYCNICYFTQLNKANVLKHLREHHSNQQAIEDNVKKCVLAAIQDAQELDNENILNSDQNIVVLNEAIQNDVEIPNFSKLTDNTIPEIEILKRNAISHEQNTVVTHRATTPTENLHERSENGTENQVPLTYKLIPPNTDFLGLYKCMVVDCYYSTDNDKDMVEHLEDHSNSLYPPEDLLQCPYCVLHWNECNTSMELVQHIRLKHQQNIYQCSMCCYRSCDASNVSIHQQLKHQNHTAQCVIYKCIGKEILYEEKTSLLNKFKLKSVQKLQCPLCESKYYTTVHLQKHLNTNHQMDAQIIKTDCLKTLSCIYCDYVDRDKRNMHIHVARDHPDKLPYICDHNVTESNEDTINALQFCNLSEMVAITVIDISQQENNTEVDQIDIKPNINEMIKIRLRKLTENTGIDLNNLYRCPQTDCNGYFSTFELWLRHMKKRHSCIISFCPHCPQPCNKNYMSLNDFETHFEKHRRHTYVCFHCSETFKYENQLCYHGKTIHQFEEIRFETVEYGFNLAYKVLIKAELHRDRMDFVRHYVNNLDIWLKKLEEEKLKRLQYQWLIPETTVWIEQFSEQLNEGGGIKCINESQCNYCAKNINDMCEHMKTQHFPINAIFHCKQCYFVVSQINNWDGVLNHVKTHINTFYICCVCSHNTYCRAKMTKHIKTSHDARDVPVITLFKKSTDVYVALSIVFASGLRSFSTMRNCFCCNECNMTPDRLLLHLKQYHKLTLTYFCELCKIHIQNLQLSGEHFNKNHQNEKIKIHCKLAYTDYLSVVSIYPLVLNINKPCEAITNIKKEEDDDNAVVILEDDDISTQEDMLSWASTYQTTFNLQCIPTNKLLR